MADVDHPKTHVEDDKDVKLPRKQPESPKHEGIDPLTESDTMYPAENTKNKSEALARREEKEATEQLENDGAVSDEGADKAEQTVTDQNEVNARANTPNSSLPEEDRTDTTAEQERTSDTADASGESNEDLGGAKNGEVTSDAKSDNSPKRSKNAKDSEGDKLPQTARPTNPSVNDANSEKGDRK